MMSITGTIHKSLPIFLRRPCIYCSITGWTNLPSSLINTFTQRILASAGSCILESIEHDRRFHFVGASTKWLQRGWVSQNPLLGSLPDQFNAYPGARVTFSRRSAADLSGCYLDLEDLQTGKSSEATGAFWNTGCSRDSTCVFRYSF